jgi:hypothetical protein
MIGGHWTIYSLWTARSTELALNVVL